MQRPIVASDLMNPEVLSVEPDMSVQSLAAFLVDNEIGGAPVVEDGLLVGVVSLVDVAEAASATLDAWVPGYLHRKPRTSGGIPQIEVRDAALTVRDVMTREVQAVDDEATVSEVARLMLDRHLHRVLVTRDGELVGIISSSDMLGLLVDED